MEYQQPSLRGLCGSRHRSVLVNFYRISSLLGVKINIRAVSSCFKRYDLCFVMMTYIHSSFMTYEVVF